MNRWIKTQFEGVYIDRKLDLKNRRDKFRYCVQRRGKQFWSEGYPTAAAARDARLRMKVRLIDSDGKIEPRRMPVATFEKVAEELVKSKDIRKTISKSGRARYSIMYANGNDYSLFDLLIGA